MTDPLGQSQVLPYLCGLSAKGYQITLISAEKSDKYAELQSEIQRICSAAKINWQPVFYTKKPPVISTVYDIFKIYNKSKRLHSQISFDLIHCRSYISGLVGLKLKKKYNLSFLFDMRGFWVDEKVDGNIWNLKNPIFRFIYNYMKKKEKQLFSEADQIISLTHKACPIIHQICGTNKEIPLIDIIPCCVDVNHFSFENVQSKDVENWKLKLGINEGDTILTYLGSLSTWYLPLEMLNFFKIFLLYKPTARFIIITQEDPTPFRKMAESLSINADQLLFTSSNRKELPALLSLSNASVFFIKPAFSKAASSPTKLGELLSMGIPVICNSGVGDTDEIIRNSGTGVICTSFDDVTYKNAIEQFLVLQKSVSKEVLREKAIELFSLESGVEKYQSVYKHLLHQE